MYFSQNCRIYKVEKLLYSKDRVQKTKGHKLTAKRYLGDKKTKLSSSLWFFYFLVF